MNNDVDAFTGEEWEILTGEKPESEFVPDIDFCSRCREHTDFEQDELGEWLSVCCSVSIVEMP